MNQSKIRLKIKKIMSLKISNLIIKDMQEVTFKKYKKREFSFGLCGTCKHCPKAPTSLRCDVTDIFKHYTPMIKNMISYN